MKDATPIIFIDDDRHIRNSCIQTLELAGFQVHGFEQAEAALPLLSRDFPGVVVSDVRMPGMDGMNFLERAQQVDPDLPVILITGHGDIALAVQAMRAGAYDFIEKPFPAERLAETVNRACDKRRLTRENRALRAELETQSAPGPRIIGRTPAMQRLRATVAQIADTDADVLVLGETGTGKELVARSLHEHSRRRARNFAAVNCGAVAEGLLESELFGHEAGAFTGAKGRRIGRIEHADGGTLFLDEIESMSPAAQVHLLRVLQERSIERLGSNKPIPLDLRVVAATKVDLREAPDFRDDLYYRLNVVSITIPPLRERREDIPLLFHHFLLIAGPRYGREAPTPRADQMRALLAHNWPGNVRELRNLAERYVLLGESVGYEIERLLHDGEAHHGFSLAEQVEMFERSIIEQELATQKGSIKQTMEVLALPRKTLYDKMRKYGLDKRNYKDS
jgi:two-component system C4-dicarboxylate transport response regulator DctD